jgi:GNAT superfamily N-acetyltransferase
MTMHWMALSLPTFLGRVEWRELSAARDAAAFEVHMNEFFAAWCKRYGEPVGFFVDKQGRRVALMDHIDGRWIDVFAADLAERPPVGGEAIYLKLVSPDVGEIGDVTVFRHKNAGWGSALMRRIFEHVDRLNLKTVTGMISSLDFNDHGDRLVRFYERHGFVVSVGKSGNGTIRWTRPGWVEQLRPIFPNDPDSWVEGHWVRTGAAS